MTTTETQIKASEVRIGNWILSDTLFGATPFQIRKENFIDFEDYDYKPIPLTTEILEKVGFDGQEEHGIIKYTLKLPKIIAPHGNNLYELTSLKLLDDEKPLIVSYTVNHYWAAINCQYLHQLQNLYHSLTGEELEINL